MKHVAIPTLTLTLTALILWLGVAVVAGGAAFAVYLVHL